MEFENLCGNSLMLTSKKLYRYECYEPGNPLRYKYVKSTGTPDIKRQWCLWTRNTLAALRVVTQCLDHAERLREACKVVNGALENLKQDRVPLEDLVITRCFEKAKYDSRDFVHVRVGESLEARQQSRLPNRKRIGFLIVEPPHPHAQLFECGVEWTEFDPTQHTLNKRYYVEKQLYNPVLSELDLFPEIQVVIIKFLESFFHSLEEDDYL